ILIRSAYEWEATLAHIDEQDGKNDFDFHFTSWKTENGRPKNDISMNMLLTSIEKMFYELDPQATMEMHKMQFSTKTSFF
ncbi:MAG: hypothetical protein IJI40_03335, partial [Firmicutes bacterium]|nr:hypothetical protein [Bacillota bacterium]